MKKLLIFSLCVSINLLGMAQEKKAPATKQQGGTTKAPAKKYVAAPAPFTAKDSMLCKQWKLSFSELFSVKHDLTEVNKNDAIAFLVDKTVIFTMEGKKMTGTWTTDRPKVYIFVTIDGTNEKMFFKLVSVDKTKLVLDYKDKEEFHTVYTYEATK